MGQQETTCVYPWSLSNVIPNTGQRFSQCWLIPGQASNFIKLPEVLKTTVPVLLSLLSHPAPVSTFGNPRIHCNCQDPQLPLDQRPQSDPSSKSHLNSSHWWWSRELLKQVLNVFKSTQTNSPLPLQGGGGRCPIVLWFIPEVKVLTMSGWV